LAAETRKQQVGTVVSDRNDKTVVVKVSRQQRHRLYRKPVRRTTKFVAHDEVNSAKLGDTVRIEETRPLSRRKRWRLLEIVQRADLAEIQPHELDHEPGARVSGDNAK
jgi:small subunit ribosomal protein S17